MPSADAVGNHRKGPPAYEMSLCFPHNGKNNRIDHAIEMKILFTTDLHGNKEKYGRLFLAAKTHKVDAVINGGDMLPFGKNLFSQGRFITDYLNGHFSKFNDDKIHYLCCPGNDDLIIFDDLLDDTCNPYPYVVNLAQRKVKISGFEFIGMNWVVDYPFPLKDRCRMDTADYQFQEQYGAAVISTPDGWKEIADWHAYAKTLPTIADELDRLVRPENMAETIYIMHMPPVNLGLDQCRHGPTVGSKAIFNFLRTTQPRLSLHGHIHESPESGGNWIARLGDTTCIQPGQLEPFTFVLIDVKKMKFDRYLV